MSNQVAAEALYSATYVKNYLDSVENLPDDVQRHLSRIRDIDVQYRGHLRDVDHYYDLWRSAMSTTSNEAPGTKRIRNAMARIQQNLIAAQELGDEKLQIVNQLQDLIDHKTRQLDTDFKNLDYGKEEQIPEVPAKIPRPATPVVQTPLGTKVENQTLAVVQQNPQRGSTPTSQTVSEKTTTSNTTERSNKRSRRPRNETNNNATVDSTAANENNATNDSTPQAKQSGGSNGSQGNTTAASGSTSQKKNTNAGGASGSGTGAGALGGGGKKKKRKARGQANNNQNSIRDARDDTPPPEETIDPDEPTYCLCDQISFGEMILCDNDLCPIEWFHFSCVSLSTKPKGKWFCPNCRGDRPNVMKPKAQFLKELERYNKEKEEKT